MKLHFLDGYFKGSFLRQKYEIWVCFGSFHYNVQCQKCENLDVKWKSILLLEHHWHSLKWACNSDSVFQDGVFLLPRAPLSLTPSDSATLTEIGNFGGWSSGSTSTGNMSQHRVRNNSLFLWFRKFQESSFPETIPNLGCFRNFRKRSNRCPVQCASKAFKPQPCSMCVEWFIYSKKNPLNRFLKTECYEFYWGRYILRNITDLGYNLRNGTDPIFQLRLAGLGFGLGLSVGLDHYFLSLSWRPGLNPSIVA